VADASRHQLDGDDGFLRKAKCQVRRHNPDGDAIYIDGTVARKYVDNGKHLVEIRQKPAHTVTSFRLTAPASSNCRRAVNKRSPQAPAVSAAGVFLFPMPA